MRPGSFVLLICVLAAFALSAQDTTYYDQDWKVTLSPRYQYYRVVRKGDGRLNVEDHYRSGQIQMQGSYTALVPREVEDGHFTYYAENGAKTRDEYYKAGLLEGPYLSYDSMGRLLLRMQFRHDKWDGQRTAYYPAGGIYRDEIYKDGVRISGHCYDEKGREVPFFPMEELPVFPGGDTALLTFINERLIYPEAAKVLGIEGTVIVKYTVGLDGGIEAVSVFKSDDIQLDSAAIEVIMKLPKYKPARLEGKPSRYTFLQPVAFKLRHTINK